MTTPARLFVSVLAVGACLAAGCGDRSMPEVHGEVTLDGKPLREGSIRFEPMNGNAPTAGALIKDGHFTTSVPVGENKVEINAWEIVPPKNPGGEESTRELLPPRYNEKSKLTLTVEQGRNEAKFDLQSK